jgi:hypothetical protein
MTSVQDILLMPDGHTLVVAVKAAHCLRLLDIHKLKVSVACLTSEIFHLFDPWTLHYKCMQIILQLLRHVSTDIFTIMFQKELVEERLINMNEAGDDHVSFTARHLALSPNGK